jgi:hypothetical protein
MCQETAFLDSVNQICNMRQSKLMRWVELPDSPKTLFRANLQVRKKRHEGNTDEFKHPRVRPNPQFDGGIRHCFTSFPSVAPLDATADSPMRLFHIFD